MSTKIQARIDDKLKTEVEAILADIGVTTTELMRMTFRQVAMRKGLPFEVKIPNAETIASFEEVNDPSEYTIYETPKEALDDILGED